MAKLEQYRTAIQTALSEYARMRSGVSSSSDVEIQTLFDSQHDRYQLVRVGWYRNKRIYSPLLHLDLKNEKVWLQLNTTEDDITVDLMRLGIPKEDIVLAFHPVEMREFTDFAVS